MRCLGCDPLIRLGKYWAIQHPPERPVHVLRYRRRNRCLSCCLIVPASSIPTHSHIVVSVVASDMAICKKELSQHPHEAYLRR